MSWDDQQRTEEELLSNVPSRYEKVRSFSVEGIGDVDHQNLRDLIVTMFAQGGGGVGGSGWIIVKDVVPVGSGVISAKVWQDSGDTVLQECTTDQVSFDVEVAASFPLVTVAGVDATLVESADGGHYEGTVPVTIAESVDIECAVKTPDDDTGAIQHVSVILDPGPEILTLSFTGSYPGSQTELKEGDTFQLTGTTDKPCTGVRILDYDACQLSEPTFVSTTTFVVDGVIADRGDVATPRYARVQARNAAGAYGSTRDTSDTVICNNLHPTATIDSITYPGAQQALKGSETATVGVTLANLNTVLFDSPNSQLNISNPTTVEASKTAQRIAGDYNVSVNNFRITANRAANDATTVVQDVVQIAHVACEVVVTEPAARLRSGGNDGTSAQNHTITLTANQELLSAPSLSEDTGGGTFLGSWTGGPAVWTRSLQVHDDDVKGTYNWQSLSATNLAGIVTSVITGDDSYVLGGFVQRDITFGAFSQQEPMGVAVVDYTKLQAGIFTATNQQSIRHTPQGDTGNAVNEYTILTLGVNPAQLWWNDVAAASSNSSGTAQLLDIEETP